MSKDCESCLYGCFGVTREELQAYCDELNDLTNTKVERKFLKWTWTARPYFSLEQIIEDGKDINRRATGECKRYPSYTKVHMDHICGEWRGNEDNNSGE